MDEARLKEIEDVTSQGSDLSYIEARELIAALRLAWKLLASAKQTMEDVISEEGKRFNDRWQDLQVKQLQERAARAEAERDELQAWKTARLARVIPLSETIEYQELVALRQVREAAESAQRKCCLLATLHSGDEHPVLEQGLLDIGKILQDALDAAKDPAR